MSATIASASNISAAVQALCAPRGDCGMDGRSRLYCGKGRQPITMGKPNTAGGFSIRTFKLLSIPSVFWLAWLPEPPVRWTDSRTVTIIRNYMQHSIPLIASFFLPANSLVSYGFDKRGLVRLKFTTFFVYLYGGWVVIFFHSTLLLQMALRHLSTPLMTRLD